MRRRWSLMANWLADPIPARAREHYKKTPSSPTLPFPSRARQCLAKGHSGAVRPDRSGEGQPLGSGGSVALITQNCPASRARVQKFVSQMRADQIPSRGHLLRSLPAERGRDRRDRPEGRRHKGRDARSKCRYLVQEMAESGL